MHSKDLADQNMKIDREFDPAIEAAVDSYVAQNNLVRQNKDIGMDQGDAVVSDSVQSILLPMIQAMVDPDDIRSDLALAAFDDIPLLKRIELLIEFAAGHHTADTHWPLPELVFNELSLADNFDGLDMDPTFRMSRIANLELFYMSAWKSNRTAAENAPNR
jgi:hypothetical protein